MGTKMSDLRKDLEARIVKIQDAIMGLKERRGEIDKRLKEADQKLNALRVVYGIEAERLGERKGKLFTGEGVPSRFAGMRLVDALALLKKEHPGITKKQAHDKVVKEGFNFRTARTLSAVHFAWVGLNRRKKKEE